MTLTTLVSLAGEACGYRNVPVRLTELVHYLIGEGRGAAEILASAAQATGLYVPAEWSVNQ